MTLNIAPFIVAKELGYYRQEGYDLEIIRARAESIVSAMVSGEMGYAFPTNTAILGSLRGLDLKILMIVLDKQPGDFFALPQYKSFADLKGKKIGVPSLTSRVGLITRDILIANGLTPGVDVTLLVVGDDGMRFQAMKAGAIDGSVLGVPFNFYATDSSFRSFGKVADLVPPEPQGGVFATQDRFLRSAPEVHKFLRASLKGYLVYRDQEHLSIPIIQRSTKITDKNLMARIYRYHRGSLAERPWMSSEAQRKSLNDAIKTVPGKIRTVDTSDIYDFNMIQNAAKELIGNHWKP